MSGYDQNSILETLVKYFQTTCNFDHPDMGEVIRVGEKQGVNALAAGKAFFVARERASLHESELLDGGHGQETDRVKNYGADSIYQMLFENQSIKKT